jgi:hypothetical protein
MKNMLLFKTFARILILTTSLLLIACQPQMIDSVSKNPEAPTILPSMTVTYTIKKVLIPTDTLTRTPPPQEPTASPVSLVERVLFDFGKPLPDDIKIGLNFDGQEIELNGYILPHGNCCSAALLNPRQNGNVLIFFLNKDSQWYYLEAEPSIPNLSERSPL